MSEHVLALIGPYHDGELSLELRGEVENHLAGCAECRSELDALRGLSGILAAEPGLTLLETPAAYARRLIRQLPKRETRGWERLLGGAWRLAPAALFSVWAFFQAAIYVAGGLGLSAGILPGGERLLSTFSLGETSSASALLGVMMPGSAILSLLEPLLAQVPGLSVILPLALISLGFTAFIGVLYLGWLASLVAAVRRMAEA